MKPHYLALAASVFLSGCSVSVVPTYVTDYRSRVFVSDRRDEVPKEKIDEWTLEALAFWMQKIPHWSWCTGNWGRLKNDLDIHFVPKCPVRCNCGKNGERVDAYGYIMGTRGSGGDLGYEIVIGDCDRDRQTYMHEISHLIVAICGGITGEESHELFEIIGLPGS